MITLPQLGVLLGSSVVAGVMNSIAGGGTLFTFPALIAVGVPPLTANGTNAIALIPGSGAAAFGYRRELGPRRREMLLLGLPSLAGGVLGASLGLRAGDTVFARLVPWLLLTATLLFLLQDRIARRLRDRPRPPASGLRLAGIILFQLVVSMYGGFFGAGMGILILAALAQMGFTDIHEMNGLKNLIAICINGTAAMTFIAGGRVLWPYAALMAAGAVAGGYGGARLAHHLGPRRVRRAIVIVGFGLTAIFFLRQL